MVQEHRRRRIHRPRVHRRTGRDRGVRGSADLRTDRDPELLIAIRSVDAGPAWSWPGGFACLLVALLEAACAGRAPSGGGQLTLIRDDYGVPHVYADDRFGLFYGYGYAVAQDRLFQMEMARRSTQGRVAEVLGADFVDFDRGIRRNFDPISIRRQLAALEPIEADILEGYAAGVNAWIDEVRADPARWLPAEYSDFGFRPGDWTAYDVAMLFVGTLANRYADFNTEIDNARILEELTRLHGARAAAEIFDQLNPRFHPDAPTTIAPADWQSPAGASGLYSGALPASTAVPAGAGVPRGYAMSNCFVLGRKKVAGHGAILVNGPQFGWYAPSYVYSVGLHGAGFDLVGNTPFAIPALLFGHNQQIAWGSTWGAGDMVDIYRLELNPQDSRQYRYRGRYRPFDARVETIEVKGGEPVLDEVLYSVHGPVILHDAPTRQAYAKRRTWEGHEIDSLMGWVDSTRAQDYSQWIAQAKRNALNINWYYADRAGNIGYAFTGRYPTRVAQHDNRLPAPGGGGHDWSGVQPFEHNPQVLNPGTGYIANWNNKPAAGALNPDEYWYSWSHADRVDYLIDAIESRDEFDPEQAWGLIEGSSYADVNAPYFLPLIARTPVPPNDPRLGQVRVLLGEWDRESRDRDRDGFYDEPATAIFRRFLAVLVAAVLEDDLGAVYPLFSATGYPTMETPTAAGTNIQTGVKTIVEALQKTPSGYDLLNGKAPDEIVAEALAATVAQLSEEQGPDPVRWRLAAPPRPYSSRNFLGIPQGHSGWVGRIEQNRGTENHMVVLSRDAIVGYEVTPPGQSGFIAPDGAPAPHLSDQLDLYDDFGRKRMWFYRADVEAHQESKLILSYRRPPPR